ncbi:MAG: hypothetical protein WAM63_18660, partial [Rhodomicrobium sp.]
MKFWFWTAKSPGTPSRAQRALGVSCLFHCGFFRLGIISSIFSARARGAAAIATASRAGEGPRP